MSSAEEVLSAVRKVFPDQPVTERARLLVEDIADRMRRPARPEA